MEEKDGHSTIIKNKQLKKSSNNSSKEKFVETSRRFELKAPCNTSANAM